MSNVIYDDKTAARILAEAERMVESSKATRHLPVRSERIADLLVGVHPRHFHGDHVERATLCHRELQQVVWRSVATQMEVCEVVSDRAITRRMRPGKAT